MNWKEGLTGGPFSESQVDQFNQFVSGLNPGQVQWLSGYFAGVGIRAQLEQTSTDVKYVPQSDNGGSASPASLLILYGTQTGNSEKLAKVMEEKCSALHIKATVRNMAVFRAKDLKNITNLAVIVSTQGTGEPPVEAEELYNLLHSKKAPRLDHLKYSVLALGDTSYEQFCQTGRDFDNVLAGLGASRLCTRVDCDVDYEDDALEWMDKLSACLQKVDVKATAPTAGTAVNGKALHTYSRKNPYEAVLTEKIMLNGRGSSKETVHLEFSLNGSGITYTPGDVLGVYAPNSASLVEAVLNALKFSGKEEVDTHAGKRTIREALTADYELTPLTSLSVSRYADLSGSSRLKKMLEDKLQIREYLSGRDILDLVKEFPFKLDPQQFISLLRKNTARMYSIASSQQSYEDEVHLLVSVVKYDSYGRRREGLCSSFLGDRLAIDDKVKVFVESNSRFRMPAQQETPVIMVGPGTGVAPFRAFMQQRELAENRGKSWLFFGDRNFTTDFLYQTEWQQYLKEGILSKMDVAFSRDQAAKEYVQHKMLAKGRELYEWLEGGAHFYVCGDAHNMAKDVDKALREIVMTHGSKTPEQAEEYVKYLQLSNRYQTDVY